MIMCAMAARLVVVFFIICAANTEVIRNKFCDHADNTMCSIHEVNVEPCPAGPGHCRLRRGKTYSLTYTFTPHFDASSLLMSVLGDEGQKSTYTTNIMKPTKTCTVSSCGLKKGVQNNMNITFSIDQKVHGKFPIQVKMWDEQNAALTCCFTFKARMKNN